MQDHFSFLQYGIFLLYILASVGVGLWFARGRQTMEDYYLAERSAPAWASAISIISSDISAVSYLGCAAIVFTGDLQMLAATLGLPLGALFVSLVFIPVLARHQVYTVYEYLGHRFGRGVRNLASVLFLLMRGSHLAVALYAASLVLAEILGLPRWTGLVVLGGITTLYTMLGGMRAVLWTDVIQFFVLVGGVLAVLAGVGAAFHWDFAAIWRTASGSFPAGAPWLAGKPDVPTHTRFVDFTPSLVTMNFWSLLISGFFQAVGSYGSDQVLVQRYLAAGSQRKMTLSLLSGSLLTMPVNALLFAVGGFLVAYYAHFLGRPDHAWIAGLTDPNRVMPHFIMHGLPGILSALVMAGLFAGTMASFSAGLNSLSTATYVDFIQPRRAGRKDGVALAKAVTGLWGLAIVLGATLLGGDEGIFAILARVMGPFAGPLLGMFLLGLWSRHARSVDVVAGAVLGIVATVAVGRFTPVHWLWYYVVGTVVGVVAGYLLSLRHAAADRSSSRE